MMLTTSMQSAASSSDVFEWRNTVCALCALDRPVSDSDVIVKLRRPYSTRGCYWLRCYWQWWSDCCILHLIYINSYSTIYIYIYIYVSVLLFEPSKRASSSHICRYSPVLLIGVLGYGISSHHRRPRDQPTHIIQTNYSTFGVEYGQMWPELALLLGSNNNTLIQDRYNDSYDHDLDLTRLGSTTTTSTTTLTTTDSTTNYDD